MGENDFHEKLQIFEKSFHSILFHLIFSGYYCSINLKRQSEHYSGLRPDTSSLVLFSKRSLEKIYERL